LAYARGVAADGSFSLNAFKFSDVRNPIACIISRSDCGSAAVQAGSTAVGADGAAAANPNSLFERLIF
jgi:hypothetical protein